MACKLKRGKVDFFSGCMFFQCFDFDKWRDDKNIQHQQNLITLTIYREAHGQGNWVISISEGKQRSNWQFWKVKM